MTRLSWSAIGCNWISIHFIHNIHTFPHSPLLLFLHLDIKIYLLIRTHAHIHIIHKDKIVSTRQRLDPCFCYFPVLSRDLSNFIIVPSLPPSDPYRIAQCRSTQRNSGWRYSIHLSCFSVLSRASPMLSPLITGKESWTDASTILTMKTALIASSMPRLRPVSLWDLIPHCVIGPSMVPFWW